MTAGTAEQSVSDVPVLVNFWAPHCGPCRRLAPLIEELAAEAEGRYRVGQIDAREQPDLSARFRVSAVPTLLVFKSGQVVNTLVGYQDKAALQQALRQIA